MYMNGKEIALGIFLLLFLASMTSLLLGEEEIVEEADGTDYPNLLFVHGQVPSDAPEKVFEAKSSDDSYDEFDDGYGNDDYEQLDFDENWN